MSDSYHEIMSYLFNSPFSIPKWLDQPTGMIHCRVARQTPLLDPQVYQHMQLKIGQKDEKKGKSLNLQTYWHMHNNTGGG